MPDIRQDFMYAVAPLVNELIVWNAPDHEQTKLQLRAWLDECIEQEFAVYEVLGGDRAV